MTQIFTDFLEKNYPQMTQISQMNKGDCVAIAKWKGERTAHS
jgi:hypothetical protein